VSCDWKLRFECVLGISSQIYNETSEENHHGLTYQSCARHVDVNVFHCTVPLKIVPTHPEDAILCKSWNAHHVT
jgi:hypothetical protein